jgi:hypothetical protein
VCVLVYVLRKINKNYLIIYKFAIIFNLIIKELLNLKNNKKLLFCHWTNYIYIYIYIYIYKKKKK